MDSLFRHQPVDTSTEMFECVWVNGSFLFYRPNQPHSDGGLIFITTSSNTRPFHGIPQTGWMTLDSWRRETNFRGELKQTKRKKNKKRPITGRHCFDALSNIFWSSILSEKKRRNRPEIRRQGFVKLITHKAPTRMSTHKRTQKILYV
jgi:hypothetical protein